MRNLKKILALVLALVMSLSLVTTAGAFSDDGDINANYDDAIDVLSKLEVFQGYSDGSFKPQGEITRAEVAAIIYRIVTADVKDNQKEIYSTWGKFTDVSDGAWFAGYVNYCANAGYIKGRGNNKFDPQANVTGYEALAMILRAVGYDKNGEFTGSDWQVRTASTARERGVLKKVTEGLLGQKASRELVAEILFRSIIIPKVDFNANTLSYKERGAKETIGYESFKLEEITGVVTANEKADLNSNSPMPAGKVRMAVDSATSTYTINDTEKEASGFDALGETYHAYITDADKTSTKVLKIAKSDDSKSWETWEEKEIDTDKKFLDATGFERTGVTQLVNYGTTRAYSSNYSTDWRIRYVIERPVYVTVTELNADGTAKTLVMGQSDWILLKKNLGADALDLTVEDDLLKGVSETSVVKNFGTVIKSNTNEEFKLIAPVGTAAEPLVVGTKYTATFVYYKTIPTGRVSGADMKNIEDIFKYADKYNPDPMEYITGEVYVGTTSLNDESDKISFQNFKDNYLKGGESGVSWFSSIGKNDRGNYLKVIDNDNDGRAEYALKTVYTMAQVVKVKDDKYGLDTRDTVANPQPLDGDDRVNFLDNDDVKCEGGALVQGDIVYYAMIDGQGWAYKAETETVKVTTVNRADRKIKVEGKDEDILESDVHGNHVVSTDYSCGVTNMNGYSTYTIYKDGAGNVALFNDANNGDFKLIIDGWFNQTKNGKEYAVWTYNDETGRQERVDVTRGGSLFINDADTQNNDWGAMSVLAGNGGNLKTTVATLTGDGILQPADYYRVNDKDNNNRTVAVIDINEQKVPTSSGLTKGTAYQTSVNGSITKAYNYALPDAGAIEVRALASTVYYIVYPSPKAESGYAVERYVGYANVPKVDETKIEDVYAVGTLRERTSTLGKGTYYTANVVVVEMSENKQYKEQAFIYDLPVASYGVSVETVKIIDKDGVQKEVEIDFEMSEMYYYHQALDASDRWRTWRPGLYFLYETGVENRYYVEKMDADDITANNYAAGYVSTTNGVVRDDYIDIYMLDNNNNAYGQRNWTINNDNIYKLKYKTNGLAIMDKYKDTETRISEFLSETKPGIGGGSDHTYGDPLWNGTDWNWNRVLVHYDESGRYVNYVISFDLTTDSGHDNSLTRSAWNLSRPDSTVWSGVTSYETALSYARFMNESRRYGITNPESVLKAMANTLWGLSNNSNRAEADAACKAIDPSESYKNGSDTLATLRADAAAALRAMYAGVSDKNVQDLVEALATKINTMTEAQIRAFFNGTSIDTTASEIASEIKGIEDAAKDSTVTITFTGIENAVVKVNGKDVIGNTMSVDKGAAATLTVAAKDSSYEVKEVTINGTPEGVKSEYILDTSADITVDVDVARKPADNEVSVTVTPNANVTINNVPETVEKGGSFTLTVEANAGYDQATVDVSVNGGTVAGKKGDTSWTVTADADSTGVVVTISVDAVTAGDPVNETTNVTLKYKASKITKDLGDKNIVNNVLELTYDDVMPAKKDGWVEVKPLVITDLLADGATAAKGEAGGWKLTVTKSTGGSIEITVDWTTEIVPTEKSTSRRARAGEEGKTLSAEVDVPSGWKLSTDYENPKFWVTMGGITVNDTAILIKGEEWNRWQITAVTTGDYSSERGAYITTFLVSKDDTEVKDTSGVSVGTELKPTGETWNEVSKDGNQVTVTEFQTEDGSLTINQKVELIEDAGENGEDITKSTFDVTASGADDTENMKTPGEVASNEKFSLSDKIEEAGILESDQDALVLNQFTATGPAGSEPQVEIDRSVYDVVCVSEEGKVARAGEDSVKWFIYIVLKVEKGTKTPIGEVKAEIKFSVTFEEPEPVIDHGKLKVWAVTDTDLSLQGKYVDQLQKDLKVVQSDKEDNTWIASGETLYVSDYSWFGSDLGKGYFIALAVSYPNVAADSIKVKSANGPSDPGPGQYYKSLDRDGVDEDGDEYGIIVWRLNTEGTKTLGYIEIKVSNDVYKIDLAGVSEGLKTDKLTVEAFGADETIKEGEKSYGKTGGQIQTITGIDVDPDDNSLIHVTGTTKAIGAWSEYGKSDTDSSYFVALKFTYPRVMAGEMQGYYGSSDTTGKPLGKSDEGVKSDKDSVGVALIQLAKETDGSDKTFKLEVRGKTYTIDLSGVQWGDGTSSLALKEGGCETNRTVLGKEIGDIQEEINVVPEGNTFKVTGNLKYVSKWTQFSRTETLNTGYFVALSVDEKKSAFDLWKDITVSGAVGGGTMPGVEEEENADVIVWQINPDPTKKNDNKFTMKLKGIEYTVDLSELKPISPLTVKATAQNDDMGEDYGNLKASEFCNIECDFADNGENDTIVVTGDAYYVSPMQGFATGLDKGWYVALDFGGIVDKNGTIEIKQQDMTDGGKGSDSQDADFTFLRKIYVMRTGTVPICEVEAFGKTFKLDLSQVNRVENLKAEAAPQTLELDAVGDLTNINPKIAIKTVQGESFTAVADMYTRTITLSGDVYKQTNFSVYQSSDNTGYFAVIDLTYPSFGGEVKGFSPLRTNGIELNKAKETTKSGERPEQFGWIIKLAGEDGNFFTDALVLEVDGNQSQGTTQLWRVVDGGLNFTEAPKTDASN